MALYLSPHGDSIVGTSDIVRATALISGINDDGSPVYAGQSEIDWDSQATKTRDGCIVYLCEAGEEWTFDQLVKAEEDEGDEDAA